MTKQSPSKRQLQTRTMLKDAFFRLMEREDYGNITVSALCQEADLARRTFYRHYETLDDLVTDIVADYVTEFLAWRDKVILQKITFRELVEYFFVFWEKKADILLLFDRQKMFFYVSHVFDDSMRAALSSDPEHPLDSIRQISYITIFGGLWQLLHVWLQTNPRKSITEMGQMAEQMQEIISHFPRES